MALNKSIRLDICVQLCAKVVLSNFVVVVALSSAELAKLQVNWS